MGQVLVFLFFYKADMLHTTEMEHISLIQTQNNMTDNSKATIVE